MELATLQSAKELQGITFAAVVAMTPSRVIGKDGGMPWHLPDDLKVFKRITTGHPVVMGRRTYESIGRPLPNRQNIVLTRNDAWSAPNVQRIGEIGDLLNLELLNKQVCIIGGAQVYGQFLPVLDDLWVSMIKQEYEGDTWFPEFESHFEGFEVVEEFAEFTLRHYFTSAKK
jgi:dihydrofolate reductase